MKKLVSIFALSFSLTGFLNASEIAPTKEEVSKLYIATFNRASDMDGLNYWLNTSNLTLSQIAQSFFDQPETKEKYPYGTSTESFINSVYKNLFNRVSDTAGLNYWKAELDSGKYSKNLFILTVINGALGDDKTILENKNEIGLNFANSNLKDINYAKIIMNGITADSSSVDIAKSSINNLTLKPDDEEYYKYLWHLKKSDSDFSTAYEIDDNSHVNIAEAWKLTKGANVKIAIIDDNFEINHEDLKDNIIDYYNADNDNDDVSNKTTEASHGTTCAGFIVAPMNKIGIIGTAPESKLIVISNVEADDASTIRAFNKAKEKGAKVINCSWGTGNVSEAVSNVIKEMYDSGISVIFASGNNVNDLDGDGINDESELDSVLGIGASSEKNDVTSYSDYGKNIDLLAPGGDVYTSLGILGVDETGNKGEKSQKGLVNENYAFTNGTSFSAPLTAGIIALMYSANPNLTPSEVKSILIETADKIGGSSANYINGFDQKRAYGKINAGKAVLKAFHYKGKL